MISEYVKGQSSDKCRLQSTMATNYTVERDVDLAQEESAIRPSPTLTSRMDSGLRSGHLKAAEERAWARGRGMRLLKIG